MTRKLHNVLCIVTAFCEKRMVLMLVKFKAECLFLGDKIASVNVMLTSYGSNGNSVNKQFKNHDLTAREFHDLNTDFGPYEFGLLGICVRIYWHSSLSLITFSIGYKFIQCFLSH